MQSPTGEMVSPNGTLYKVLGKQSSKLSFIKNKIKFDLNSSVFNEDFSLLQKSRIIREDLYSAGRWTVQINEDLYSAGRWAVEIHCEDRINL